MKLVILLFMGLVFLGLLITQSFAQNNLCVQDKTSVYLKPILTEYQLINQNPERFHHKDQEDLNDEKYLKLHKEITTDLQKVKVVLDVAEAKLKGFQDQKSATHLSKKFDDRIESMKKINASRDGLKKIEPHMEAAKLRLKTFEQLYQDQLSERYFTWGAFNRFKDGLKSLHKMIDSFEIRSEKLEHDYQIYTRSFFEEPKKTSSK